MRKTAFILLCSALCFLSACKEEGADLRPGLYVDHDIIEAFGGKEVRISGQASCYAGFDSFSITCAAWKINDVTDLSGHKPVVWNFDYTLVVPADATFPQYLTVTATDVHGTEMKKMLTIRYAPATTAPFVEGLQPQMAVDYDTVQHQGECTLSATLYGEDRLTSAVVEIPDVDFKQTYDLKAREEKIAWSCMFTKIGSYPMTITVNDNSGNQTVSEHLLIVMIPEKADPVEDYPYLWAFKSNTKESDYIFGFYQYMSRRDDYCYDVTVYAETDDTEFMFAPKRETNGARKFGQSPYVEGKVISMQDKPDYVIGYKPGQGYWGLTVDLRNQIITKWEPDYAGADKSQLYVSADWNSWTFDAMQAGATPYQQQIDVTIKKGNQYFCFATATDWTHMWRVWNADGDMAGWWFSEDGAGDGATLPAITEDVQANISFDTAIQWCYIKKK